MRIDADRLTLRNVDPLLKRALSIRAQQKKQSMEKTILEILQENLEHEIKMAEIIDQIVNQSISS